jgi:iron(III) transport system substrate-binding protein
MVLILGACILASGCIRKTENEVVLYVALDREFSEPLIADLERELKIRILAKYDQESNKTVGLVNEILQNPDRPRADLFWNNEIMHTVRLDRRGQLEAYDSPIARSIPSVFVSPAKTWYGFAARARVLLVNKNLIPDPQDYPTSIFDLANAKWKGKCALAKPLFGTTATHAAVLFEHLGFSAAENLLTDIARNAVVEGGNKTVATRVSSGQYYWGLTDTDDAIVEIEKGQPVAIVFPDQGEDQFGTLLIPNTIGLIKHGPNSERAKALLNRLLQTDIELKLAEGRSAQIPLSRDVVVKSRVMKNVAQLKVMEVDFQRAGAVWDAAANRLEAIFNR